jgi:hypothetical protein
MLVDGIRGLSNAVFGGFDLSGQRDLMLFVHIAAFVGWAGPAMGASWFVYVASWERAARPEDAELLRREQWVRRQFNRVVALEHVAFAALVVTGLMLAEAVDWAWAGQRWLDWKLLMVCAVFIPMELADVVLSAWLGRASRPGADGLVRDADEYARAARWQDLFLRATIPPVMIGIPITLYLAVAKPA